MVIRKRCWVAVAEAGLNVSKWQPNAHPSLLRSRSLLCRGEGRRSWK